MISGQEQFAASRVYHDANSLAQLKFKGKDNNPEAIKEAAKQFESIFIGMMLKSMRDANAALIEEPLLDSSALDLYRDMHDEQLSVQLGSSNSGLGLADILVQQLTGKTSVATRGMKISEYPLMPQKVATQTTKPAVKETDNKQVTAIQQPLASKSADDERGLDFSSPVAFVKSLWPYAQKAANLLKLDPKILIAQAALETGWGKFVIRTEQGTSSKNMFGIKATESWQGPRTQVNTLEVEAGVMNMQKAAFRTYDSYADSFTDYAQFISGKERYQKAINAATRPESYMEELQAAGYATDPEYANKIANIYNSSTLNNALESFATVP